MIDFKCKVRLSANLSITNNSETFVQWDIEDYDVGGLHDNVTNKNRVTIPTSGTVSGLWLMQAQGEWAAGTTGYRFVGIQKGGGLSARGIGGAQRPRSEPPNR